MKIYQIKVENMVVREQSRYLQFLLLHWLREQLVDCRPLPMGFLTDRDLLSIPLRHLYPVPSHVNIAQQYLSKQVTK